MKGIIKFTGSLKEFDKGVFEKSIPYKHAANGLWTNFRGKTVSEVSRYYDLGRILQRIYREAKDTPRLELLYSRHPFLYGKAFEDLVQQEVMAYVNVLCLSEAKQRKKEEKEEKHLECVIAKEKHKELKRQEYKLAKRRADDFIHQHGGHTEFLYNMTIKPLCAEPAMPQQSFEATGADLPVEVSVTAPPIPAVIPYYLTNPLLRPPPPPYEGEHVVETDPALLAADPTLLPARVIHIPPLQQTSPNILPVAVISPFNVPAQRTARFEPSDMIPTVEELEEIDELAKDKFPGVF